MGVLPLVVLALSQANIPESFPLENLGGEGGVKATLLGKPVAVAFDATWTNSRMSVDSPLWRDPASASVLHTGAEIQVGGKGRVTAAFIPAKKDDMPEGADLVLGADALRKMTLAFDPLRSTVEFLGGPKIGPEGAARYFAKLPVWTATSKVVRLPLVRDQDGTPLLTASVADKAFRFAPRFAAQGSILAKSVPHPQPIANEEEWDYLSDLLLPGLEPGWTPYDAQDDYDSGGDGMLALDAFGSRRIVVDLGDDAVYVERLPTAERESLFLSRMLSLPVLIRNKALMIGLPPGEDGGDDESLPDGVEIVSIGKVRAEDWIADLHAGTPKAAARLTVRLAELAKGYEVTVIDGEGNVDSFNVPGREESKRQAPPGSPRVGVPVPAASRSR